MWDEVDRKTALRREKELKTSNLFFKPAITKGARMFRHNNTPQSARKVLSYLIKMRQTSLRIQEELVDRKIDIAQTAVGLKLQGEIAAVVQKHKQDMIELQAEIATAIEMKDAMAQQELGEAKRQLEGKIRVLERDNRQLTDSNARPQSLVVQDMQPSLANSRPRPAATVTTEDLRRMAEQNEAHGGGLLWCQP